MPNPGANRAIFQRKFKCLVKNRIEKRAAKHLLELQKSHFKYENLDFKGFKPAEYLM